MFLKKEKPEFEIRPLYSIREELELIKEFCWQPKLAAGNLHGGRNRCSGAAAEL